MENVTTTREELEDHKLRPGALDPLKYFTLHRLYILSLFYFSTLIYHNFQ